MGPFNSSDTRTEQLIDATIEGGVARKRPSEHPSVDIQNHVRRAINGHGLQTEMGNRKTNE
jgi:hypothetical protein